jgi:hypothetical protein
MAGPHSMYSHNADMTAPAQTRGISVITDPAACADLWCKQGVDDTVFDDWDLRCALARISDVEPYFVVDEDSGTVLPTGRRGNDLLFYGGRYYSEWNSFRGRAGGERRLMEWLAASGLNFRLLAWKTDPWPYLAPQTREWDVPFNQYWMRDPGSAFEDTLVRLPAKVQKEARYLTRKFTREAVDARETALSRIAEYMDHTVTSFAKRGARCAYAIVEARDSALAVCRAFAARGALRLIELQYNGRDVGLVVLIDDLAYTRAVYLLNLYRPSPSDISNGATVAVLDYACRHGRPIDGLRGAFTLKRKFNFHPLASYALVNDPRWVVRPQTDLDADELHRLYGRAFGRTR